jgi:succinyl-CoA synthetase beta subunit
MNIHEYQAKDLFRKFGISVPGGKVFQKESLTLEGIRELGEGPFVVKVQIHAGGRGKAGGVKIVKTAVEALEAAKKLIGTPLATYQTAGAKKPVDSVLVEISKKIKNEIYLALTLDRDAAEPCVIFSEEGGVDIEEIARKTPHKILKCHFDVDEHIQPEKFHSMLSNVLSSEGSEAPRFRKEAAALIAKLSKLFVTLDASLVEVNPLCIMADGLLTPIDAKINFDDNALFRHPEIAALRDPKQDDERENEAKKFDLSYVGLEGNIGCMVNGAGLAMATMDIIKLGGGEPANFLDVGGGASKEKVAAAFKIILKDPRVKAILVNIFGGIMRCDILAQGIVEAQKEVALKVPLIVRLEGTNVDEGREILKKSKINIVTAESFEEGAHKAVGAIK